MARLVTLFGGGGFLGRYVAQELLRQGARIRVVERDPRKAWFLKPLGGLGQTQFAAADITDPVAVARVVQGSDSVINLVGVLNGRFDAIHVDGARNAARAARDAGADAFVQISAIGADASAESAYARSKGEGEAAVRDAFPGATILRPSIVFGPEDKFLNRFATLARRMPVLPVIRGTTKFQPVFVDDVARAVAAAALDPAHHGGQVYELGGPQVISMGELNAWIAHAIGRSIPVVDVPDELVRPMAKISRFIPGAPITWDQWLMLGRDNVVAQDVQGFDAFGISPSPLSAVAPGWLVQYRRQGRFSTLSSPTG